MDKQTTKKTKVTPKKGGKLQLKWVRSAICAPVKQKLVIKGLGFTRLNQIVERPDTLAIRGMVRQSTAPGGDRAVADAACCVAPTDGELQKREISHESFRYSGTEESERKRRSAWAAAWARAWARLRPAAIRASARAAARA